MPEGGSYLVVRTQQLPEVSSYNEYEPYLREDFWYSCAYCSMTEVESLGFRFEIDHYLPSSVFPEKKADYKNLLYCCAPCNGNKLDFYPGKDKFPAFCRLLRPDEDNFSNHFSLNGLMIEPLTEEGKFTAKMLRLNGLRMRKIRELREKVYEMKEITKIGLRALKSIPFDGLSETLKNKMMKLLAALNEQRRTVNQVVIEFAKRESESLVLSEHKEDVASKEERRKYLESIKAIQWFS